MAFTPNSEPAAFSGATAELVRQAMYLALAFELVHWTQGQQATVGSFTSAFLAFASIIFTRRATVPVATANKQIETAIDQPTGTSVQKVIDLTKARSE